MTQVLYAHMNNKTIKNVNNLKKTKTKTNILSLVTGPPNFDLGLFSCLAFAHVNFTALDKSQCQYYKVRHWGALL
jgi:hypothetical protein